MHRPHYIPNRSASSREHNTPERLSVLTVDSTKIKKAAPPLPLISGNHCVNAVKYFCEPAFHHDALLVDRTY